MPKAPKKPTKPRKKKTTPQFQTRGARIKEYRYFYDLKRAVAVERTGLSLRTYSDAERGLSVSDDTLLAIAKLYHMDFDLLKNDPRNHPKPGVPFIKKKKEMTQEQEDLLEKASRIATVKTPRTYPRNPAGEMAVYELVEKIHDCAQALSNWLLLCVQRGSTLLILQMPIWDVQRLFRAFYKGALDTLEIDEIVMGWKNFQASTATSLQEAAESPQGGFGRPTRPKDQDEPPTQSNG